MQHGPVPPISEANTRDDLFLLLHAVYINFSKIARTVMTTQAIHLLSSLVQLTQWMFHIQISLNKLQFISKFDNPPQLEG